MLKLWRHIFHLTLVLIALSWKSRVRRSRFQKNKPRPVSISIVMLKKFTPVLPKGRVRKQLALHGQIQTMRVIRQMGPVEIRTKILKAFNVSQYTVLETDGTGHGLLKAAEQV